MSRMVMRLGLLALLLAGAAACTPTRPTEFYTLATVTGPAARPGGSEGLTIGLGPISLPQYLDRPEIVTREGTNQMRLAEFHRWAEPLEPLITRIMAEDLYALLDARDVSPLPQRGDLPLDRAVEVDIGRFDADAAGEVVLDARWRLYRGDSTELLASGRSLVREPAAPVPDYAAIVAAMSRAVGQVSEEIAQAIAGPPPVPARRERVSG